MQTLKINKNGQITLPKSLRSIITTSDKIAYYADNDTIIIKRINPPKLSEISLRTKAKPMPLKDIVKEVHAYRKEKRK